jgi:hypothetical protein
MAKDETSAGDEINTPPGKTNPRARTTQDQARINARQRERYRADPVAQITASRAYREEHRDEIAARRKARYEANPEPVIARAMTYYEQNREAVLARARARYAAKKVAGEAD